MSVRFNRRAVVLGATAISVVGRSPSFADDMDQANQGQGTYWQPALTQFFVVRDKGMPTYPEADGAPMFPFPDLENAPEGTVTPEIAREKGLLHFSLLPGPLEGQPSVEHDWVQYDKLGKSGEHASAIAVARHFGKPRLYMHRCIDEDYLATYPDNQTLYAVFSADIIREKLPIPGNPSGKERTDLIRSQVLITHGKLLVTVVDGVRPNGSGGELKADIAVNGFNGERLGSMIERPTGFNMTVPTIRDGDHLNGVYSIKIELDLQAGPSLGLAAKEVRRISGEIRVAIGYQYLDSLAPGAR